MAFEFTYQQYISDISTNRIPACKKVKLVVKRHIDDIKQAASGSFPYCFDHKKAQDAILFFTQLTHTKGKLAGTNLKPEPWQQFIIASIYGWRRVDNGLRRFRRAYIQIARKNGKTFLSSGVALYDLITEPGAEVMSAGTTRDQAARCFEDCRNTVRYSKTLRKYIQSYAHSLKCGDGTMKALSSDAHTLDGLFYFNEMKPLC